jgi:hypothetical protein
VFYCLSRLAVQQCIFIVYLAWQYSSAFVLTGGPKRPSSVASSSAFLLTAVTHSIVLPLPISNSAAIVALRTSCCCLCRSAHSTKHIVPHNSPHYFVWVVWQKRNIIMGDMTACRMLNLICFVSVILLSIIRSCLELPPKNKNMTSGRISPLCG